MSSRGRTRKGVVAAQAPITDHFSTTRRRNAAAGKDILDAQTPATRAKRNLFDVSSKEAKIDSVETNILPRSRVARQKMVKELKEEKNPISEGVSVETKTEQGCQEKVLPLPKADEVKSMIPSVDEVTVAAEKKKIRSVVELQEKLAKTGKARILHEQTTARKLEQVAERERELKSPRKQVIVTIGGSPPKRARNEERRAPVKVLPIPDFVLPRCIEKKKKEAIEEPVEGEAEEDSMTRAPKGYGSSLLVEGVKEAARVTLPTHFKNLLQLFIACDRVVSIYEAKGQTITLSAVQKDVQSKMKQAFTRNRFAQLLSVYGEAYRVQLKKITGVGDAMGGARVGKWEYVIKPNLDDDLTQYLTTPLPSEETVVQLSPIRTPSVYLFSPTKGRPVTSSTGLRIPASPKKPPTPSKTTVVTEVKRETRKRLEGWRLSCRQQVFRYRLAQRVIQEHDAYLQSLGMTPPSSSSSCLPKSLHPSFLGRIESLCPFITEAPMEEVEDHSSGSQHQGMSEFLEKASAVITTLPKGVDRVLEELKSPEKKEISSRGVPLSPLKFAQQQQAQPKTTMSLLERIRAKEAARKMAEMQRNPETEEKMKDIDMLLKRQLRILFSVYQSRSRLSLDTNQLCEQLMYASDGRMSKNNVLSLLRRLASLVPSHFTLTTTSLGVFLKVSDNGATSCEKVESILRQEMDKCEKETSSGARAP